MTGLTFFPLVFIALLLFTGGVVEIGIHVMRRNAVERPARPKSGFAKFLLLAGCGMAGTLALLLFAYLVYFSVHRVDVQRAHDAEVRQEIAQLRAFQSARREIGRASAGAPHAPRPAQPPKVARDKRPEIAASADSAEFATAETSASGPRGGSVTAQKEEPVQLPSFREEIIDEIGRAPTAIASHDQLPEWAADPIPPTRAGNTVRMVLASERFATLEEAEGQLEQQLRTELMNDLRDEFPVLLREDPRWRPTEAELRKAGVFRRTCVATYPLEVGEFTEPVYQLFWDVELNPLTRQRLYASWRPAVVNTRLKLLGGSLAALCIAMGLGAVVLRS